MKLGYLPALFLYFILDSCTTSMTGSTDTEIIKQLFETYKASALKEDYNALFDLIYPEVFSGISKKEKIEDIKTGMHNADYDIVIKEINNDSTYQVEKHGLNKYSLITGTAKASFYLKHTISDSLSHIRQFYSMCNNARTKLGDQNVTCNVRNNSVDFIQKSKVYFIFDLKYKKWFLLSDDNPEDVEKYIPLEIRRKYGIN